MEDVFQEYKDRLESDMHLKKMEALQLRLDEMGIKIDVMNEIGKTFSNLKMCVEFGTEFWYYNDGSDMGKRIMGFISNYSIEEDPCGGASIQCKTTIIN